MLNVSKGFLGIEDEVPCAGVIDSWLQIADVKFDTLVSASRQFERAYVAWQAVRKVRNPFFDEGTGFEGYFVGICESPEQMTETLIKLGHTLLTANQKLYRLNARFQSQLVQALTGEHLDYKTISVWSDLFGATLGRLRCNIIGQSKGYTFQMETYRMTGPLSPIRYVRGEHRIHQAYVLPYFLADRFTRHVLNLNQLKPSDYDAGQVVDNIGRFGHPLVREYLRQRVTLFA